MIYLLGIPEAVVRQFDAEHHQQSQDQRPYERGEGCGFGPGRNRLLRDGGGRHQARMDAGCGEAGLHLLRTRAHGGEGTARGFRIAFERVQLNRRGGVRECLARDRTERSFQLACARRGRGRLAPRDARFTGGGVLSLGRGRSDDPGLFLLHAAGGFRDLRFHTAHFGMFGPVHHGEFAARAGQVVQLPSLLVE